MGAVLGLVPARGGSKGIPRKNLTPVRGLPLIAHTILAARKAHSIDRLIVSTEDEEIAEVAERFGAEVPFRRPVELAGDLTPDLPVFLHALEWLERHEGYKPDLIAHLRPTSPLRTAHHIDEAVAILQGRPEADSVRSVSVPSESPFKMWRLTDGFLSPLLSVADHREHWNLPRQLLPAVYWQNACIDVTRYATIANGRSMTGERIVPYVMTGMPIVDIDTSWDVALVEMLLTQQSQGDAEAG